MNVTWIPDVSSVALYIILDTMPTLTLKLLLNLNVGGSYCRYQTDIAE